MQRIVGAVALLVITALALVGAWLTSGEGKSVVSSPPQAANILQGTLLVNGQARNGLEVKLWRAEAFDSPPGAGDPEPIDQQYQEGTAVVTGLKHGGHGAYRFTGVPDGDYYASIRINEKTVWEGHSANSGVTTRKLRSQVHEYARADAGQTITLAHIEGAGVVRQIFVALTSADKGVVEDDSWVKVYVNGQTSPSIAAPVSQFFAYTHEAAPFQAERIGVTRKIYPGDPGVPEGHATFERGAFRYIDIPFGHEIRLTLEVGDASHLGLWSIVYYHETPAPLHYGRMNHLEGRHISHDDVAPYGSAELLNVQGRGSLDSMVLSGESPDGHQALEGNLEIYVDGETTPSIHVSGTEDITGNAFYFGNDQLAGQKQGATVHQAGPPTRWTQYRFFDPDRVDFDESLRVVWIAGHKGQGAPLVNPVRVKATHFYYLDTPPALLVEPPVEIVVDEDFTSYGEGNEIGSPWVQWPGSSKWSQQGGAAIFEDTDQRDSWMYHSDTDLWADQIVEAEVEIGNHGTGEVWLFARGTDRPGFADRITFGFSAVGAEPEHPNYQPVMLFVASTSYSNSSLLLVPAGQRHTLRLDMNGVTAIASLKRQTDQHFRELFRHEQTARFDGYSGVSVVTGNVKIHSFKVYRRP